MNEQEVLAQQIAGDHYGLSLEDARGSREQRIGRLTSEERKVFDAGWEAGKQYYTNQPKGSDVQS